MIHIKVYKIDVEMGNVYYSDSSGLKIVGDKNFNEFISALNDDEYINDREFVRDLPDRLGGLIHAQLIKDD